MKINTNVRNIPKLWSLKPNKALLTLFISGLLLHPTISLGEDAVNGTTDGLTLTQGVFYPSHSIQGMTYNPTTQSYGMPSSGQTPEGEGSSGLVANGLSQEEQTQLYNDYTNAADKPTYLAQRTPEELSGLFQYMGTSGGGATEQNSMLTQLGWQQSLPFLGGKISLLPRVVSPAYFGLTSEQVAADVTNFNNFLKGLSPSDVKSILAGAGYGHDRVNYSGVNLSAGVPESTQAVNSTGTPYIQASTGLSLAGINLQGATGLTASAVANSGGWEGSQWISSAPLDLRGTGITRQALTEALNQLPLVSNGRSPEGDYLQAATDPTFSRYALEWSVPANVGGGTKIMVLFDGDTIYPNNVRPD